MHFFFIWQCFKSKKEWNEGSNLQHVLHSDTHITPLFRLSASKPLQTKKGMNAVVKFCEDQAWFPYPWIRVQLIPQYVTLLIWVDDDWLNWRICSAMAGISLRFRTEGKAILWLGSGKTSWITRECTETFLEERLCQFSFFLWCEKQVGVFFPLASSSLTARWWIISQCLETHCFL